MRPEPTELTEARDLLGQFDAEMTRPDSLVKLASALSLLSWVRTNAPAEMSQVATNLATAHAKRAGAEVESLLAREPSIHSGKMNHWDSVLAEFSEHEFTLPPEVAETQRKLGMRMINKTIHLFSHEERQQLIALLKEDMNGEQG